MISVKEMPRRFRGSPVVKASLLTAPEGTKPHQAVIITILVASDKDAPRYNVYHIGADALDGAWSGISGTYGVDKAAADAKFREYEQRWI